MDYKEYFYRLTRKKTNFQWILGVYYVRKRQSGGENRQLYDVITLFGKILGMVREQLLAANYGTVAGGGFCWQARFPSSFFDVFLHRQFLQALSLFLWNICRKRGGQEAFSLANPLYYDDFDRYAFDDASGDGVCEAADASDCARL